MAAVAKVGKLASDLKMRNAVTQGVKANVTRNQKENAKNIQQSSRKAKWAKASRLSNLGSIGPLNPFRGQYMSDADLEQNKNILIDKLQQNEQERKEKQAMLEHAKQRQNKQRELEELKNQHQAQQLGEASDKAGHTLAFIGNGLGSALTSIGSGALNVTNILGGITKSAGSTVSGATDTAVKRASSEPVLWLIVGVIFVLFLAFLIFGLVKRSSGGSSDDEYDDSNVTRIEINGDFNSIQRGQTYSSNTAPISRPSFTKAPDVNGGMLDWIMNSIATTEPFASGKTYYNMVKAVATGGSLVKINREEDVDGRHDNIVAINVNNEIHNILAPKPVIWSINEYQRDDLRILPNEFKKKIQDKYTVYIPWEKDGDHYYVKCNKTYYGNDKNKKINILLDTSDKDMCSIYQDGEAKPLYK